MLPEPPVRLCCGKRHDGSVCLDGKVMCQLCYSRFGLKDLYTDSEGAPWDICKGCEREEAANAKRHA